MNDYWTDFATLKNEANKNEAWAQFEIGLRYYEGRNCPRKNQPMGVKWMEKAADNGYKEAIAKLMEIGRQRPTYRYLLDKYLQMSKEAGVSVSQDVLKFTGDKDTCLKIVIESLEKAKPDTKKAIYWASKCQEISFDELVGICVDIIKRVSSEIKSKKQLQRHERALAQFLFKLNDDIANIYDLGVKFILGKYGLPICKTLGATLLLKAYNALGKEAVEFPQLLMSLCYCNIKGIGISKNMKNAAYLYILAGRPSSLIAFKLNQEDNGVAYKKPTGRKWNYYVTTQWIVLKIKKPVGRAKDAAVDTSTSYAKKVIAFTLGLIFLGPTMLLLAWLMASESELQQSTTGSFEQDEIMRGNAIGSALITIFFQLAWSYGVIVGIITLIAHFGFDIAWTTAIIGGGLLAIPIGLFVFVKCLNYVSDVFPRR